jgi:hypothetical protein
MEEPRVEAAAAIRVAAFRGALRSFLNDNEQIACANRLTPQRYLLLLMIKGLPTVVNSRRLASLSSASSSHKARSPNW